MEERTTETFQPVPNSSPPRAAVRAGIPAGERRPDRRLLAWYAIQSLAAGPFFFFPLLFLYFKFRTLRYVFDDEGVSMRWGVLFRREVSLTYTRIQDLHLVSNVIERWLGLGRIQVQTASGSAKAEMTLEGLPDYEDLRDRMYARMRGAGPDRESAAAAIAVPVEALEAITEALREAAEEVRALRARLDAEGADA